MFLALVLIALFTLADCQGMFPCHASKAKPNVQVVCDRVIMPPHLCRRCPLRDTDSLGRFEQCDRIYNTESDDCHLAIAEYVNDNPCDTARARALEGLRKGQKAAIKVVDYFLYAVCEQCCDCIPMGVKESEYDALSGTHAANAPTLWAPRRGNCPAHAHFDVCKVLPHVTNFARRGDAPVEAEKICPLLAEWQRSSNSSRWQDNPQADIKPQVDAFLNGMNRAMMCADAAVWNKCFDLENKQQHLAVSKHFEESSPANAADKNDTPPKKNTMPSKKPTSSPSPSLSPSPIASVALVDVTVQPNRPSPSPTQVSPPAPSGTSSTSVIPSSVQSASPSASGTSSISMTTFVEPSSTPSSPTIIPLLLQSSPQPSFQMFPSLIATTVVETPDSLTATPCPTPFSTLFSIPLAESPTLTTSTGLPHSTSPISSPSPPPPAPTPAVASTPSASANECFPASASVELLSGHHLRMSDLRIGDPIRISSTSFSPVFLFSHRASLPTNLVVLHIANHSISLTPGHLIYASHTLLPARRVRPGHLLTDARGEMRRVTKVEAAWGFGLYNPHTMHGDIVVDGFVASTFTEAVQWQVAEGLLTPVRALFHVVARVLPHLRSSSFEV